MHLNVKVDATPNEKRRFLGYPDITPLVELASEMLDDLMLVVVEARLAALNDQDLDAEPRSASLDDEPAGARRRAVP